MLHPNHYHCPGVTARVRRSSKAIAQCTCNCCDPTQHTKASLVQILIRSLRDDGWHHLVFIVQYPIEDSSIAILPNHPRG